MNFLQIPYLFLNFIFYTKIRITEWSRSSVPLRGNIPDFQCTLLLRSTDFLDGSETEELECQLKDGTILPLVNLPESIIDKFNKGQISSGNAVLSIIGDVKIINHQIEIGGESQVKLNHPEKRVSSIVGQTGVNKVLVLKVDARDTKTNLTEAEISEKVFGINNNDRDSLNFRGQMQDCSFGKVDFQPATLDRNCDVNKISGGVHSVYLPFDVDEWSRGQLANNARRFASLSLGLQLTKQYDIIVHCLPPIKEDDWIGYANLNSGIVVVSNRWCTSVSLLMHEVGHTLSLRHSNFEEETYGDKSGVMGYSSFNDLAKCFNAVKSWQLGWYVDRQIILSSPYEWSGKLYGFVDYDKTSQSENMIIRMNDSNERFIFVSYNNANGMNEDTSTGKNEVLVHSVGTDFGESVLLATLKSGENHTLTDASGETTSISVIDVAPDNGYATIEIESIS